MSRLLPHPVFSVTIWLLWLIINNSFAPGTMLLGALLAVLLPLYSSNFWPDRPKVRRPWRLLALLGVVLWDIVIANFQAAKLILGPRRALRPGFVIVPLDLHDPVAITMLTSFISLTPGTVSAELSADRKTLAVHALDVEHPDQVIEHIKRRYEAPLVEIF